ncbi:MAG: ABC transporter ATP-binding protein [Anaerolineales bacterium]|nr:ABC transporter ATP-binding protein [Anaerolineales bacterium]
MLKVEGLDVCYGDLQVLWDVSLEVEQGDIVALIGPNGAGKTTTLKTIAGLLKPSRGQVTFCGERIDRCFPHQIVDLGLSLVPEWKGVFASLSVLENLELGAFPAKARPGKAATLSQVFEIFPILAERQAQKAGTLSGGERQMLAIGRAMMSRPTLLMLDEPSLGLAPLIVKQIFEVIKRVSAEGVSILLVEQNVRLSLEIARHAYVIESGRIVQHDSAECLLRDERVKEAYLGL